MAPGSAPSIRAGGSDDDEGGPGDTPASVAWLRAGRGTGYDIGRRDGLARSTGGPAAGRWGRPAGTSWAAARSIPSRAPSCRPGGDGPPGPTVRLGPAARQRRRRWAAAADPRSRRPGRARAAAPAARRQHRRPVGLGALARAVRPDRRLPAPPLDPHRRHARDRRAAHRHRAPRAGDDARPGRRPVRQARRRDDQAHQARPARPGHARRDRRDAPAHRARLRGLPRPRPPPRGDPGGLRDAPGGRHGRRLPGREPGPDADAAEVAASEPGRPRRGGRDHPAGADPGQRRPPVPAPQAGPRAGDLPPSEPGADPRRHPRA